MSIKISGASGVITPTGTIAGPVGPVSQAAGVPTGNIVESGNTGLNYYVRYADGTQECYGQLPDKTMAANDAAVICPVTFARPFINATGVAVVGSGAPSASNDWYGCTSAVCSGISSGSLAFRNGATLQNVIQVHYRAIGRWF